MKSTLRATFVFLIFYGLVISHKVHAIDKTRNWAVYVQNLETKLKDNPKDRILNLKVAEGYVQLKKWEKALEYYKKANNPTNVQALEGMVVVLEKMQDYLELIRALEILLQQKPNIPKYMSQLGWAYMEKGDPVKAAENFRAAIKVAPQYEKAYEGLLELFERQNNFYEADMVLKDAVGVFGKKTIYLSKTCKYKTLQNYYEDAKVICQDAVLKAPQFADNHIYLGLAYRYTGEEQQARKIIISAARKFKSSELAQFYGGQISDEIKNWEQAVMFYKQGAKAQVQSSRCHLGLAKALFELKKYKESLDSFLMACSSDNTVDKEIRRYAGLLRGFNQNDWYLQFKSKADNCVVIRSRETK